MSGITGIYNLDGRPVDAGLLRRMTEAMAHRGPDGAGCWTSGPVGFGHRLLATTPESVSEREPLTNETGDLCLTFDGRVDNREELRAALEARGFQLRSATDAELVLRTYECWGEGSPRRILGDFAFAIWDGVKRQLFCARDIMGVKPLYYYSDKGKFLCASELHQILEDDTVPRRPNEGMIAECLAGADPNLQETLYQEIYQLPRAHALIVRGGRVRPESYWDIDGLQEIRYENDEDYAQHLFEIFREAVRCRLRSHRLVAAELSGGLDSSSIVSMTQWLLRQGAVDGAGFETFSMVFPGLPWDESAYVQEVVQRWGLRSNAVLEALPPASTYVEQAYRYRDLPHFPGFEMFNAEMALAQEKGARVILTGVGGDQWLMGSLFHNADLLRRLKLWQAVHQSRMDSRILAHFGDRRAPLSVLFRYGALPLVPASVRRGIRRALRRNGDGLPTWIGPQFGHSTRLAERLRRPETANKRFATIVEREHLGSLLNYPWYFLMDRYISRFGLEYRHPFLDRRVIEYCLALPQEQLRRGEQTKFVLRQAMREFLPPGVQTRLNKPRYGSHTYRSAIAALGGERFFDALTIASLGWVDSRAVKQIYQSMAAHCDPNDEHYDTYLWPLWMVCGLELWFKTVFAGGIPLEFSKKVHTNAVEEGEQLWSKSQKAVCSQ